MKIFLCETDRRGGHDFIVWAYEETKKNFHEVEEKFRVAKIKYEFDKAYLMLLEIMKDAFISHKGTHFEGFYDDKYLFDEHDIRHIMGNSQYTNALKTINDKIKEYKTITGNSPNWASEARKYAKIIDNFIEERKNNPNLY